MAIKNLARNSGFTIIETIITLSVFLMVLLALFTLSDWQYRSFVYESTIVRLATENQQIIDEIQRYVQQASEVKFNHEVDPIGVEYESDADTIIVRVSSLNSGGTATGAGDWAIFDAQGSELHEIIEPNDESERQFASKILTDSLTSLEFKYYDAEGIEMEGVSRGNSEDIRTIKVRIELQAEVRGVTVKNSLEQYIYFRNR